MVYASLQLNGFAQERYTFSWESEPLEKCLSQVADKSDLTFYYVQGWLEDHKITLQVDTDQRDELLSELLSETGLFYKLVGNAVILTTVPIIDQLQTKEAISPVIAQFSREISEDLIIIGRKVQGKANATISGKVSNENGDPVIGTLVFVKALQASSIVNAEGEYALELPTGKHILDVQSVGYESQTYEILVNSDGTFNIALENQVEVLEEILVVANADINVTSTITGLTKLSLEEAKTIPKVFGENDIVQVALALPGVQNVGEGSSGFNVRGGKADQNLVLFNHSTIYNPFHFFGFFSAFSSEIVGETDLYKGSVPVEFGGRLSSILDVKMKEGETEEVSGKLGISPVTSSFSANLPIIEDRTSLVVGGRATYSDWVTDFVENETISNSDPIFYDVGAQLEQRIGDKHTLKLSGYYSFDEFRLTPDSLFSYSNKALSMDWNYLVSDKLDLTAIAAWSDYTYTIAYDADSLTSFDYGFNIRDIYFKTFANYSLNGHEVTAGVDFKRYALEPGFIRPLGTFSGIEEEELEEEKGNEMSFFIADNFPINDQLRAFVGFRYSRFQSLGPRTVNIYEDNTLRNGSSLIGSQTFSDNEVIQTYSGPEIRGSLNYLLTREFSLKGSFNMMRQYIHSLSNTVSVSPLDTWKLSDPNFRPQLSRQYSLGAFRNFDNNTYELSLELYYKNFDNLLDYKVGADLILNPELETDILQGEGRSRGVEILIKKNTGKLTGWFGYTYSRSEQRFNSPFAEETLNGGEFFPSNFDKPHDFSLISNYKINRRFSLSLNVLFSSGRPVTYPTAVYQLSGREIVHFGDRNQFRIPNYFRMDIGMNMKPSHRKNNRLYSYWSFSVYNLTSRNNVYSVFFRSEENGEIQGYELSVLASAIPSLTYNIIF